MINFQSCFGVVCCFFLLFLSLGLWNMILILFSSTFFFFTRCLFSKKLFSVSAGFFLRAFASFSQYLLERKSWIMWCVEWFLLHAFLYGLLLLFFILLLLFHYFFLRALALIIFSVYLLCIFLLSTYIKKYAIIIGFLSDLLFFSFFVRFVGSSWPERVEWRRPV